MESPVNPGRFTRIVDHYLESYQVGPSRYQIDVSNLRCKFGGIEVSAKIGVEFDDRDTFVPLGSQARIDLCLSGIGLQRQAADPRRPSPTFVCRGLRIKRRSNDKQPAYHSHIDHENSNDFGTIVRL
jgi:hypothetical protein